MRVQRLHHHFAAQVTEIDLAAPIDAEIVTAIQAAIDENAVLIFRNQQAMTDDAQIAFSAHFGTLQKSITVHREDTQRRLKRPELSDISNVDAQGRRLAETDRKRLLQRPAQLWHTDSSFRDPPGRYTFLAARILPRTGGDTEFADMRAAYDVLDEATQARIADLTVHHALGRSRELAGAPPLSPEEADNLPGAIQPLVRTDSSGRKSLYLASHASHVVGWPRPEGEALLQQLTQFATQPRFIYRHQWRDGDLAMWDNRVTMHRATPFATVEERRDMRRTTVADC